VLAPRRFNMKRCLPLLPLLGFAPSASFVAYYLSGLGYLSPGTALIFSAAGGLLVPWAIAGLFAFVIKRPGSVRIRVFIFTLFIQGVLFFQVFPPGASASMMGLSRRLGWEFSPPELHACAQQLRQRLKSGSLVVSPMGPNDHYMVQEPACVVAIEQIPSSLRERFERVLIEQDPDNGKVRVNFALSKRTGIICDDRMTVHSFSVYSISNGVHAYQYQRQ
jgi:hypothetical protein